MLEPENILKILRRKLFPIEEWLADKSVNEIMINPGGYVFVERRGELEFVGQVLDDDMINMALTAVAKLSNQDAKSGESSAIVNASIADMRIAGAISPVSPKGSFMTIRKHQHADDRPTLDDLVKNYKSITQAQVDTLIDLVIVQRKNCLIAGGTGSGKTTLTNALLSQLPSYERILTIEDSCELQVKVPNILSLLTDPLAGITARDLVKLAMRMRPDRLILGETRGDETYDLIRAFNSGHPGSISTIHADSAKTSLSALEMLFQMSLPKNASMSTDVVKDYLAQSVNVVVYAGRRIEMIDGVHKVVRNVEQICLVKGYSNGKYELVDC